MRTKAVATVGRKTVRNGIIMSVSLQQKDVFREVLLDLVGINFGNCGISIDSDHAGDVFDVGFVLFEQNLWKLPSAAEHQFSCDILNVKSKVCMISAES